MAEFLFYFGLNIFLEAVIKILLPMLFVKSIFTSILKVSDNFMEKFRSRNFGDCHLAKMQNGILRYGHFCGF